MKKVIFPILMLFYSCDLLTTGPSKGLGVIYCSVFNISDSTMVIDAELFYHYEIPDTNDNRFTNLGEGNYKYSSEAGMQAGYVLTLHPSYLPDTLSTPRIFDGDTKSYDIYLDPL